MKATLLLAGQIIRPDEATFDARNIAYAALGTPTPVIQMLVVLEAESEDLGVEVQVRITLVDSDGQGVTHPGEAVPFQIAAGITPQPPMGAPLGMTVQQVTAWQVEAGFNLTRGEVYQFRADINGEHAAAASFWVIPEEIQRGAEAFARRQRSR